MALASAAPARPAQGAPGRARLDRYGEASGNVLAGGVGYFAFFSIFPAFALAFTVFGLVLQDRPDLVDAIADRSTRPAGLGQDAEQPGRHDRGSQAPASRP